MATDQGGKRGPQSSRGNATGGPDRFRRPDRVDDGLGNGNDRDRDGSSNPNSNAIGVPPAVPGFGFSFPGMPMFPPGFMLGGAQAGSSTSTPPQPPPPGQGT